jgi:hypothetical protein
MASTNAILRGVEVAAATALRAFDHVAVVAGEGARHLAGALPNVASPRATVLATNGLDAAWEALGHAAAGAHVALIASGRDTLSALTPLLRDAARLGVALTLVLPAHGDTAGRAVPDAPWDDLASVCDLPVGVLVAGCVAEVAPMTLTALAFSRLTRRPWCVAFPLARVGHAAAAVAVPTLDACARWRPARATVASLDEAWHFAQARAPGLTPVVGCGAEVTAGVVFASRGVGLRQLRPFPADALATALRGEPVQVREPWPDAWGPGRLTRAVRLALQPGATVVERALDDDAPEETVPTRIDVCVDEPKRTELLREALTLLDRCGLPAEARCHEPWQATLLVQWSDGSPLRAVLCEPEALGLHAVMASVPAAARVLAVGSGDLRALREACGRRGCVLLHEGDAALVASCPKA